MRSISLAIAVSLVASCAFAQETAPPTVESVSQQANDTIAAVREQRDRAEDQEARAKVELAKAQRELAKAQAEIAALKAAAY